MEYGLRYVRDAPNLMWDAVLYGICWVNDTMSSNLSKYGSPLSQILSPVSISETLECKLRDVETMRRSCTSADRSDARGSLTPYPPPRAGRGLTFDAPEASTSPRARAQPPTLSLVTSPPPGPRATVWLGRAWSCLCFSLEHPWEPC